MSDRPLPSAPPSACGCREYHRVSRRSFLGLSGAALVGAAAPAWLPRVAYAASDDGERDVLVSIFLRGGCDGLTLVPPYGDPSYAALRPTLAIPPPDAWGERRALDLDGFFGFAPALAPLLDAYRAGELLVVHATGLPDPTRSHFSAMYFMEVGQPSPPAGLFSGWIGRHLASMPPLVGGSLVRGVGVGYGLQRSLVGGPATVPSKDLAGVGFGGDPGSAARRRQALGRMYEAAADATVRQAAQQTLRTVDLLQAIDFHGYVPAGDRPYPEDELGWGLRSVAALLRADVGVEAAALDLGGWDSHELQAPHDGFMFYSMDSLARGLAAFHADLAAAGRRNVIVVVQSEFGRNAHENGSLGTDHGHGGVMLLLGAHVAGGRVLADWPGLAPEGLYEGQDLAITIDCRDVLAEVVTGRLRNPDVRNVFPDPGWVPTPRGVLRDEAALRRRAAPG